MYYLLYIIFAEILYIMHSSEGTSAPSLSLPCSAVTHVWFASTGPQNCEGKQWNAQFTGTVVMITSLCLLVESFAQYKFYSTECYYLHELVNNCDLDCYT